MSLSSDHLCVVRVPREKVQEAMGALLAAGPAAAARFTHSAEVARVSLEYIWCVSDESGRYRQTVLAVPSPGRAVMLIATHPDNDAAVASLAPAIRAACKGVAEVADVAQALVEPTRPLDAAAFEAGGLQRIATLDYLERPLVRSSLIDAPLPPSGWTIGPAASELVLAGSDANALGESTRADIVSVLEQSYQGTRDCPGLAGMRRTTDVLDGHFGVSARARHWLIARDENNSARGVCLLNVTADGAGAELVYLGVAPLARGTGLARVLLAQGMHACANARCRSVTLALDTLNAPARKLYETSGFHRTLSRIALVARLTPSQT
jgi:ribosomal protein S18 acetylase RimI-like enzyme